MKAAGTLAFAVTLLVAHVASAQSVRKVVFAQRGKNVVATMAFTDVFDAHMLQELDSGITTTVVLRAYVYGEDDVTVPVSFTAATFRVNYDQWGESYAVEISDPRGVRSLTADTQAEALKAVTTVTELPIATRKRLWSGSYYLYVIVEVNPVSEELLAEVRAWMGKEAGRGLAGNSSFFGSMVSVFVNPKIPEADGTLSFTSNWFKLTH